MTLPRSATTLLSILCCVATVSAEDWSQWGGSASRNMVSPAKGMVDAFEPPHTVGGIEQPGTNILWRASLGTITCGSPVVVGGKVFVGTNDARPQAPNHKPTGGGMLMCFDAATGKFLWELQGVRLKSTPCFDHMNLGLCATPTVEGDRLYVTSNRCEVWCVDVAKGQVIWTYDMIGQSNVWPQDCSDCSVLIDGDVLYACTSNGVDASHKNVPRPLAASLIALDKKTGRLLAGDDEKIGQRLFHGQWSSPSMGVVNGKKQIFFGGGDGLVYAFEPAEIGDKPTTLKKIWSFDCNPPEYRKRDGKLIPYKDKAGPSEAIATPVLYKDRLYVAVGQDTKHGKGLGILNCIDATKSGDISATGKVWSCEINRSMSTVSIADGLLYILDFEGKLRCLDADTGQCYWTHDTGCAMSMTSTMVADGKVYLGTDRGDFWILAASKELKVVGKVSVGERICTTPTLVDGVIYLATGTHLYAIGKKN